MYGRLRHLGYISKLLLTTRDVYCFFNNWIIHGYSLLLWYYPVNNQSVFTNYYLSNIITIMETLAERLEKEMEAQQLTQDGLAKRSGVSQATIQKLVSGKALESRKISKIAAALGVNTDWLSIGKGGKYGQIKESNGEYGPILSSSKLIPIVGTAQLGDNGYWTELDYPTGHGDGYINYPSKDANAYSIRCIGDSMKPRIKHGEYVVVEPNTPPMPGDEVLVKATDGRIMVKTFFYKTEERVHLQSVNETHPTIAINADEIILMHYIGAIAKNPQRIK